MTTTTTATRREAQIDTEIADAWTAWNKVAHRAAELEKMAKKYTRGGLPQQGARYAKEAAQLEDEAKELWHVYVQVEEKFEGWSRFFLVQGGHIHKSMHCSTCNNGRSATRFGWLPELSGLGEADAVAEYGAILCTVCFPSAPTEWTNFYEKEAEKKAAAKCAGSGEFYNSELPHRTGYYSGNYGTCESCGERVTITSTGKLRAHKPKK